MPALRDSALDDTNESVEVGDESLRVVDAGSAKEEVGDARPPLLEDARQREAARAPRHAATR